MKVSVIIPTYNGAQKIKSILQSLNNQSFKDFELLIVIDGSTDNTIQILESAEFSNIDFKIISQENRGRAAVRNKGAELATGDWLIFFDDDMRPTFNCIQEHVRHHLQFPNSLLSGAQIDDPIKASTPFQKYKCYLSNAWIKNLVEKKTPLTLAELHLTAANFSISKALFKELGGFDESLRDNEDFDLALRAHKKGFSVFYNHLAFAWHDDFPTCETFIKRQLEYKAFHQYVILNKKDIYGEVVRFSNDANKSFLKKRFYSFWSSRRWINLVDRGTFSFLPLKVQFIIYDWIVYANTQ